MNNVWVSGDAVVDLIPDTQTTYLKCPGGAPANVAVAIARLGGKAAFIGRVGQDPLGRFMLQTLQDESVDTSSMVLDPKQRTSTVIVDLFEGERSFTFMVKPSADQFLQPCDIPKFEANQWLHVCSISLANEPSRSTTLQAMRDIKAAGGFVSFDPNLREEVWEHPDQIKSVVAQALSLADVIKFSDDELLFLTGADSQQAGLNKVADYGASLVIVTQGAKGALVVFQGEQRLLARVPIVPVDTTGAGDAFVGGLLANLARTQDWQQWTIVEDAVNWANACGALATTQKGAMTALPSETQLRAFL
ncbi:aminoimidazole riboside kinase [Alginatibacterium sediminis]|uniref:Aminoimidazole riboside kinase n=1 Tax=Alginatibacterium sediminis TaxID=2164068 RepID=A0A420EBA8_9ALTE|nr:aminoimidazole riboside kinase [Alginatibacterium sediminis]RKF17965.1 aminoimidazole riboside kinase [Alginatibacterium sediminis]